MMYSIIITQKCNLACRYCYEHIKGDDHLKEEMIPEIIEFIKKYQKESIVLNKKNITINMNGGEALLYFDTIKKVVQACRDASINNFNISTNLTTATEDMLDYLHRHNIRLHISIDGLKELHDRNRVFKDGSGSFDKVYGNIQTIREKYPEWENSYSMTFTPETVPFLYDSFRLLVDMGIRSIHASYCGDYDWDEESLEHYKRELKKIGKDYIRFYLNGERIYFKLLTDNIRYTILNEKSLCGVGRDEIAIMPNGDLIPCVAFVGQEGYKNYVIGSLKDYVYLDKINEMFFNKRIDVPECRGCDLEKRCHIECYALNYRVNGSLYSVPDCCCNVNQITLLEAEHIIQCLSKAENHLFINEFGQ
jgi:uncharacterized protein